MLGRYGFVPLLVTLVSISFFVATTFSVLKTEVSQLASVEVGYAAFSPKGALGGSIFPASCESAPPYEHYASECAIAASPSPFLVTLAASPNVLYTTDTLRIDWDILPGSRAPHANDVIGFYRVGAVQAVNLLHINTLGADPGFKEFIPNTYGITPGSYEFRYFFWDTTLPTPAFVHSGTSNRVVIGNSTINLGSTGVQLVGGGGATAFPVSTDVRFEANVLNNGSTISPAFTDKFYVASVNAGGVVGVYMDIPPDLYHASLAGGASEADMSAMFNTATPGTVSVKHCVDTGFAVAEASETDNCSSQLFTVQSTVTVTCSAAPTIFEIGSGSLPRWTAVASGGSGVFTSYRWSGDDVSVTNTGGTNFLDQNYTIAGRKHMGVEVIDSLGVSSGWVPCSNYVTVNRAPVPYADLEARVMGETSWSDANIILADTVGQQVELRWIGVNADSCSGVNFSTGAGSPVSGQALGAGAMSEPGVGGPAVTVSVVCERGGVTSPVDSIVVSRAVAPGSGGLTLTADPTRVRDVGTETTRLTYNVNGNDGCVISGPDVDPFNSDLDLDPDTYIIPSGSVGSVTTGDTGPIIGDSEFILSCTTWPTGSASAWVRVLPTYQEF